MSTLSLVILVIFAALVFDFTNGFHDTPNLIATVVSTRVLTPQLAVIWAAFFNFVAFAILGTRVAKAVGEGVHIAFGRKRSLASHTIFSRPSCAPCGSISPTSAASPARPSS